jgi:hypothetical protein
MSGPATFGGFACQARPQPAPADLAVGIGQAGHLLNVATQALLMQWRTASPQKETYKIGAVGIHNATDLFGVENKRADQERPTVRTI